MATVIFLLIARKYSTYRWSWGPRAFYLLSPYHFKANLHSGPPYLILPQLLLCKHSWHFTCMGLLCKIFHCPRLCPEKQDIIKQPYSRTKYPQPLNFSVKRPCSRIKHTRNPDFSVKQFNLRRKHPRSPHISVKDPKSRTKQH